MSDFVGTLDPAAGWPDVPLLSREAVAIGDLGGVMNAQADALTARTKKLQSDVAALGTGSSGSGVARTRLFQYQGDPSSISDANAQTEYLFSLTGIDRFRLRGVGGGGLGDSAGTGIVDRTGGGGGYAEVTLTGLLADPVGWTHLRVLVGHGGKKSGTSATTTAAYLRKAGQSDVLLFTANGAISSLGSSVLEPTANGGSAGVPNAEGSIGTILVRGLAIAGLSGERGGTSGFGGLTYGFGATGAAQRGGPGVVILEY